MELQGNSVKSKNISNVVSFLFLLLAFTYFNYLLQLGGFWALQSGYYIVSGQLISITLLSVIILWILPVSFVMILISLIAWKRIPSPQWTLIIGLYVFLTGLIPGKFFPGWSNYLPGLLGLVMYIFCYYKFIRAYRNVFGKRELKNRIIYIVLLLLIIICSFSFGLIKNGRNISLMMDYVNSQQIGHDLQVAR